MPDGFDGELYLRLAGERMLVDDASTMPGMPWQQVVEVGAALVAVHALDDEVAQAIVQDYQGALWLRGKGMSGPASRPSSGRNPLRPPRVADCSGTTVSMPGGVIRLDYVALGDRSTTVVGTLQGSVMGVGLHQAPVMPRISDDAGRSEFAHLDGGARMALSRSRFTTANPLSQQTQWIEIEGTRIDLTDDAPKPLVVVEELPEMDPAERYLRGRMTAGRHGPHGGPRPPLIDVTIETLVAAGALAPDSPVVHEVREALQAFSGQVPSSPLPDPWASLLRGPGPNTRSCTVLLGVSTPLFDGVSVSVEALMVREGVTELQVTVTPTTALGGMHMPASLHDTPISWWAQDDLGHWLLGGPTSWNSQDEVATGTIQLWPFLDPCASILRLELTGHRHRAVLHVAVPGAEASR